MLLTDGHTYGDEAECLELAQKWPPKVSASAPLALAQSGMTTFLDKLVAPSGGHSDFIETPEQVLQISARAYSGIGHGPCAKRALLSHFSQAATISYGLKISPFTQPLALSDEGKLGNLEGRSPLSFCSKCGCARSRGRPACGCRLK
jgi:Ca-activated chloride channel homolog